jgi:transcription antitermination factor NusB
MGRRASREIAMKLLYQLEIQKDDREDQIQLVLEENSVTDKDKAYITKVIDGVQKNLEYIDKTIEANSKGWKIGRISKIDLSIMRLSIFEICFMEDIPYSVSVNEAVELAKKYSNEDAGSFVNGILSKVSKTCTASSDNADS